MTHIDVLICFGWVAVIWFIIRFVQVSHEPELTDDGWISVEDELPMENEIVLGKMVDGILEFGVCECFLERGFWYCADKSGDFAINPITHWKRKEGAE